MPGCAAVRAAHNKVKQQQEKEKRNEREYESAGSSGRSANPVSSKFAAVAAGVAAIPSADDTPRSSLKEAARKAMILETTGEQASSLGEPDDAGADGPVFVQESTRGSSAAAQAPTKPKSSSGTREGVAPVGFFRLAPLAGAVYNHKYVQGFIAALIIANFISNVVEKEIDPSGTLLTDTFTGMEDFFNLIFLFELIINAYANWFWPFICSSWNVRRPAQRYAAQPPSRVPFARCPHAPTSAPPRELRASSLSLSHTHAHAHTHARTCTRTHARTHTHTLMHST